VPLRTISHSGRVRADETTASPGGATLDEMRPACYLDVDAASRRTSDSPRMRASRTAEFAPLRLADRTRSDTEGAWSTRQFCSDRRMQQSAIRSPSPPLTTGSLQERASQTGGSRLARLRKAGRRAGLVVALPQFKGSSSVVTVAPHGVTGGVAGPGPVERVGQLSALEGRELCLLLSCSTPPVGDARP
jgi:hypothetical protein